LAPSEDVIASRTHRRRLRRDERGVALVEFALVAPILFLLLFGMLDFGRAFNYWIDSTHLANEGARWAVVNKNPASSGTLQNFIQQQADTEELRSGGSASVPDPMQVCVSFPNGGTVGQPVEVTASVTYHWLPFISNRISVLATTVTGSSMMRLEAVPTNYSAGCT
jgi:Flp pilus assembly protein TadG